jgi:carbon starvation protein
MATIFAVVVAGVIAAMPPPGASWGLDTAGRGGLILWPLFGATNQLLGGLAFLVITFYLWRRRAPVWFLMPPMLFMLVMPAAAMALQIPQWLADENPNWAVIAIAAGTLALEGWMIVEATRIMPRVRGVLEPQLDNLQPVASPQGANC